MAYVTPLFHGVELARKVALPGATRPSSPTMPVWIHVVYLTAMTAFGIYLSIRLLDKRIRP